MKLSSLFRFFAAGLTVIVLILNSCNTQQKAVVEQQYPIPDGQYDSEFPVKNLSSELEFVSTTVKKLDCLAFYMSYVFAPDNQIDPGHLTDSILREQSVSSTITNEAVAGTAIVVYFDGSWVGLLTCAHVVDFPDTIITRYQDGAGPVEVVAVKVKQQNFVKGMPPGEDIEILATDIKHDIALLGKKLENPNEFQTVLNYPVGKTKDLAWGSVVYVMGYPVGQLMVTRAIVSNPDKAKYGRFITDALYNKGISGSPVLAIRDGIPNFELVGMASSASARSMFYMKPGTALPEYYNPEQPYKGELFVERYQDLKYGVTFNVSIEAIVDFLNDNRAMLSNKGFDTDRFFK